METGPIMSSYLTCTDLELKGRCVGITGWSVRSVCNVEVDGKVSGNESMILCQRSEVGPKELRRDEKTRRKRRVFYESKSVAKLRRRCRRRERRTVSDRRREYEIGR